MSVNPLPVHYNCYGVSSEALAMARGYGSKATSSKADAPKAMLAMPSTQPANTTLTSAHMPLKSEAAKPAAPRGEPSTRLQALSLHLQPLEPSAASQLLSSPSGHCGQASTSSPTSMLAYRAHTKHVKAVAPSLQSVDFVSIAVNSVGGGGVPRPYGQFTASRAGDGNATWQRLPPQPGTWQAKALPIAVTLLSEDQVTSASSSTGSPSTRPSSSVRSTSPQHEGSQASASASPRRSLTQPSLRSLGQSSHSGPARRGHQNPHQTGGPGGAAGGGGGGNPWATHEQSYYRRPGSGVHRSLVSLPPPEPSNTSAWFALPSATFLADVPTIPEHLRMDNGYSVGREFLLSGLHTKPQRHHHHSAPVPASSQFGDAPHGPGPGPGSRGASRGGDLVDALEHGTHAYPPLLGPKGLRGVYVPIDTRAHVEQHHLQQQQQQQWQLQQHHHLHYQASLQHQQSHEPQPQRPPAGQGQYQDNQSTQPSSASSPRQQQPQPRGGKPQQSIEEKIPSLMAGGAAPRGALDLPPEQTLPRRHMPTGW